MMKRNKRNFSHLEDKVEDISNSQKNFPKKTKLEIKHPPISSNWKEMLFSEFQKPYFQKLMEFLENERKNDKVIFPPEEKIFSTLNNCSFEDIKVIIIGQDPYINEKQANGMSFSVEKGVTVPPSLKNIYKEIKNEYSDFEIPNHGDLTNWVKQGVLLLNTVLTVEKGKSNSHQKKGWEAFTNFIIRKISSEKENVVFILWGRNAQEKNKIISQDKHLVLESPHPSPFSANNGFFGNNHFRLCNEYLQENNKKPIIW